MRKITWLSLLLYVVTLWPLSVVFSAPSCDYLRMQSCDAEACLVKYKAIKDCELAVIAEDQARSRRRQLQRQRESENKRKKDLDATKIDPTK
jgi:hypothetical protein